MVVLKKEHFPIPFRVTAFTLLGKLPLMLVVFFVTGKAIDRRFVLIEMSFMTGLTLCRPMLSPQQIFRVVVVVKEKCFPAAFRVTAFTLLGKLPLMLVVFFVTGKAIDRRFVLIEVPFMTGLAPCR